MIISSAYILAAGKSKRIVPPIDVGGVYMRYAYAGFKNFWKVYDQKYVDGWGAAAPNATRSNEYFIDENWSKLNNEQPGNAAVPKFGISPQSISCTPTRDWTTSYAYESPWPDNSLLQSVTVSGNVAQFILKMNIDPENEDLISGCPLDYEAVLSLGLPNGKSGKFKIRRMIEVTLAANIWTDAYNWGSGMNYPIVSMFGTECASAAVFYTGSNFGIYNFNMSRSWSGDDWNGSHTNIIKHDLDNWVNLTGTHPSIQTYDQAQMKYDLGARDAGGGKIVYFYDESIDCDWWISPSFTAGQLYSGTVRKDMNFKDGVINILTPLIPQYFGGIGRGAITGRLYDRAKDDIFVKVTIY